MVASEYGGVGKRHTSALRACELMMFAEEVAINSSSPPLDPRVDYLVDHLYEEIGIPHFQRGFVWNNENTSLLLKSLYFDTPCGTIILWEPNEPRQYGIPLSASDKLRYLVIDGQQRIRSLRDVLGPKNGRSTQNTSDEEGNDEGPNIERVWCLNLSRVRELTDLIDSNMSRYPLFRLIADPTKEGTRFKYNFIPLYLFFEGLDVDVDDVVVRGFVQPKKEITPEQVVGKMKEITLWRRICDLQKKQVFSLKTLTESSEKKENCLADMVALYNRINSAGKRVESEEKAFATPVSLYPSTNEWLAKLFIKIHPRSKRSEMRVEDLERDDILKRQKERNFGFKLFIRTFIQVCAYRFNYSPGSNTFSFEVVNGLPFQMRFGNDANNAKEAQRLFDRTDEVVQFVWQNVLFNGLYCDDLQTLPDTASLLPLFQVLIRFPKLMEPGMKERYAPALQCLALRLLLSKNQTQEEILKLVNIVNRAETAGACLKELHHKIRELSDSQEDWLEDSNTLMDRYTLMLYWLLRRNGARDFSYKNLPEGNLLRLEQRQEILNESAEPEKQHIVPYSRLKKLYNIESRGRVSRHSANNIGNITYISQKLNDYKEGLGDRPIDLEIERQESPDNLERHFLGDKEVRKSYKTVIDMTKNETDGAIEKTARQAFETFYKRRRKLIAQAFGEWIEELGPALSILEEIKPAPRVAPSLWDRVHRLECSDDIKDAMLEMISSGQLTFKTWRPKKASVEKWAAAARVSSPSDKGFIVRFFDDRLEIEPTANSALYNKLRDLMEKYDVSPKEQGTQPGNWRLPAQGEESRITSEILSSLDDSYPHHSIAG